MGSMVHLSSPSQLRALAALPLLLLALDRPRAQDPPVDRAALEKELRRVPPREPGAALSTFRIKGGFRLELVASEPDVVDPVAMAIDEDGRMFVVEMRDYPFEPGKGQTPEQDARARPGRVRLLEDLDDDGRVDRSTVFADGLAWPTGVLCWKGGIFVTAAPEVLYLKDENGDGAADRREVVYTGFGKDNVQGLLNSLRWGLDNRIYGTSGSNGGDVRSARSSQVVSVRGRDFRFRPEEGALEAISGGGQFGMCFDDWGNRFVCNNSNHIRHVVLESSYLSRNPYFAAPSVVKDIAVDGAAAPVFRSSPPEPWRLVRTRWRAQSSERSRYAPTELVPMGYFTSATGILIYRGDAFPAEYRGNAFIGDVGGNLVHRKVLEPEGATFAAHRPEDESSSEFLSSSDNWFRPVSFCEGPDGALYLVDMYRETIEHPLSIPDSIKQFLDLKSGDDRGRIYRIVPRDFARRPRPLLSKARDTELVGYLGSRGSWWRETSQRLLVERQSKAAGLLHGFLRKEENPLRRLHALFTLDGLGALEPQDLHQVLSDKEPGIREAALRLAGKLLRGNLLSWDRVLALADDPDVRVRKELALLLGEEETAKGLAALAKVAQEDADEPWVRAAVLSSAATRAHELFRELLDAAPREASPGLKALLSELSGIAGHGPRESGRGREGGARPSPHRRAGQGLTAGRTVALGSPLRPSGRPRFRASSPGAVVSKGRPEFRGAIARGSFAVGMDRASLLREIPGGGSGPPQSPRCPRAARRSGPGGPRAGFVCRGSRRRNPGGAVEELEPAGAP
jgi:putative membrane-bound dehydrogenase-like protein